MKKKGSIRLVAVLLLLVTAWQIFLSVSDGAVSFYADNIFSPFQKVRNFLLARLPFSLGDLAYVAALILIVYKLFVGVRSLLKGQVNMQSALHSLLHTVAICGVVYLCFFLGWGGNYHKKPLGQYWELDSTTRRLDDSSLIRFDRYLVAQLNALAPLAVFKSFKETEQDAVRQYSAFPATKAKHSQLHIKPSLFGNGLEYMGIQGYYNPFTGEGQSNGNLPDFLQPFLICHEMAHQAGIAAEDDANLLAFVVGTNSDDAAFRYSSYFNIWLYTNSAVRGRDSAAANAIRAELNALSQQHIKVLRELRKRYRSPLSSISGAFYDSYLKFHQQEKGLNSYNDVVNTAFAWEERKRQGLSLPQSIP